MVSRQDFLRPSSRRISRDGRAAADRLALPSRQVQDLDIEPPLLVVQAEQAVQEPPLQGRGISDRRR